MKVKKYKLKTHKGTAKRFKITASGKVVRRKLQGKNNAHKVSMSRKDRQSVPESFEITSKANIRRIKSVLHG